jgi:hypothetical protein
MYSTLLFLTIAGGITVWGAAKSPGGRTTAPSLKEIQPTLNEYCYGCHNEQKKKGGLSLESYRDAKAVQQDAKTWKEVLRRVRAGEMPPESKPQPSAGQREKLAGWIEAQLFPVDCINPDPGRVTIRRLNRAEYNNTIRDLVGVTFNPADDFPADDSGYGFDNIGDALSVSPLLLEKYLAAAEKILDSAIVDPHSFQPARKSFTGDELKQRIFTCTPLEDTTNQCSRTIIADFIRRAYRRPVTPAEVDRLAALAEQARNDGESFEGGVKIALQAVLVSPHFLFRGESQPEPNNPQTRLSLDDFALASRLSYFLWSTMPDDRLFALAEKKRLRKSLPTEVRRMLQDPKSLEFVKNFGGQWLQIRNLDLVQPDPQVFPSFDPELRKAMRTETELFLASLIEEDRSVLDLLTGEYSFMNERLARHYGLTGVQGAEFRKVFLKGTGRAGVLTHASVLTITSNPTRTSPVKRGKWVLANLLAQAPPPPPPNVPPLDETKQAAAGASLRQRMEQHRSDPMCASCHTVMDPVGFSLENFDGIGAWRDKDGSFAVDASGLLPSGEKFEGAEGLIGLISSKRRDPFVRCLAEKVLTYALGRGMESYDRCALDKISERVTRDHFRFSALIMGVVESVPFQMRRGDGLSQP